MSRIDFRHAPIQTMATSVSFPLNGHVGINALEKVTFATCSIQRKLLTKDVIGEWKDAVKNVLTDIHHVKVSYLFEFHIYIKKSPTVSKNEYLDASSK